MNNLTLGGVTYTGSTVYKYIFTDDKNQFVFICKETPDAVLEATAELITYLSYKLAFLKALDLKPSIFDMVFKEIISDSTRNAQTIIHAAKSRQGYKVAYLPAIKELRIYKTI